MDAAVTRTTSHKIGSITDIPHCTSLNWYTKLCDECETGYLPSSSKSGCYGKITTVCKNANCSTCDSTSQLCLTCPSGKYVSSSGDCLVCDNTVCATC